MESIYFDYIIDLEPIADYLNTISEQGEKIIMMTAVATDMMQMTGGAITGALIGLAVIWGFKL